jgi:hypothetical protein
VQKVQWGPWRHAKPLQQEESPVASLTELPVPQIVARRVLDEWEGIRKETIWPRLGLKEQSKTTPVNEEWRLLGCYAVWLL